MPYCPHPSRFAIAGAMLLLSPAAARADTASPAFARIFTDHAVLQRDEPLTVWGSGEPAKKVELRLGETVVTAQADAAGKWRARLPAMRAGGPYALSVSAGAKASTLKDIMIGDVYLCGGQSNMAFPARLEAGAWSAFDANPAIRFVNIQNDSLAAPLDELKRPVEWKVAAPDTTGEASAVCYHMARRLQQQQHVTVGFINSSWGGTTIQGWIGAASLRSLPQYVGGVAAVADYATSPAKALADDARRQEAWWDAHDPDAAAQRRWSTADVDDSAWPGMTPTGSWKHAGIAAFADFDGAAWFRTTVTLTEQQARGPAGRLQLGPIDTFDTTWVNGVAVGGNSIGWVWRDYAVPAGVFKPGRNVIAVRVLGGGGLTGKPEQRWLTTADGQNIALSGPWKYRPGMRAKGLSVPPAPWVVPTSLTTLYNGMIAPLAGLKFKLAAWYQGESNAGEAKEYETLLPLLMADWRRTFGQPDLPFVVAQLSSFGAVATKPGESNWARLREAQAISVRQDRHAGLAVTIDVGDRVDIHPAQKAVVGERLARAANAVAYGAAVSAGGPEALTVRRAGQDLVVGFKNTNGGLRSYSAAQAIGFETCAAGACTYALAVVQGDTVVLQGANQPGVTHVRYAWADAPYVNLYSADDLPAAPFELPVK
ncbi:MAG: sialate O-acetylesterase [Massilia sp.]